MNRYMITAIVLALAILLAGWLGAEEMISQDMSKTLQIVFPALWVITIARNGWCCRKAGKA